MTIHSKRTHCRICQGVNLHQFLSLGPSPLANSFLRSLDEVNGELYFPLDVYVCEDCRLVQLLDVIDPAVLFRNYIYVTGTSDTISKHNHDYAQSVCELLKLSPDDLVVEIASNDGSLLSCFQENQVRVLGVEPAENIAAVAVSRGVPTVGEFFNSHQANQLRDHYGPARAVIGNNVLAHVDDPVDFLMGFKQLLTPDGLAIIEVPYLKDLLANLEYDTIYHEHLCYFSIGTLVKLIEKAGLVALRVEYVSVHGGSLRLYAGSSEFYTTHAQDVLTTVNQEELDGLGDLQRYHGFRNKVENNRKALSVLLFDLKQAGYTIAGYGAPAKGNTLLNYCNIGTDILPYTVDKNPLKVGLYTPGMHIPVLPVTTLLEQRPDYVLILAWNFAREIMDQQSEFHSNGGRFILPIPQPVVV